MNRPQRLLAGLLLTGVAVMGAGCDGDPASTAAPVSTDGPLEDPAQEGGVSIDRPRGVGDRWTGSFGSLPLCVDEDGAEIRVEEVRVLESRGTVQDLTALVATPEPGLRGDLLFLSARGSAPDFTEPYANKDEAEAASGYTFEPAQGAVIDTVCGATHKDPNLVLQFTTDADGGTIAEWEVRYVSDDKEYTTGPVPWEVTLCGRSSTHLCGPPPA